MKVGTSGLFPTGSTGRGGFLPPQTPPFSNQWPAPDVMTPSRVREIVAEELRAQSARLIAGAEPIHLSPAMSNVKTDDQLRHFIALELQKYSVDINEHQLAEFVRNTVSKEMRNDGVRRMSQADWLDIKAFVDKKVGKLGREIELTDSEINRIAKVAVGPKVIELIDQRIKAALASLGRVIGMFSIDKV